MSSSRGETAARPLASLSLFNIFSDFSIIAVHLIAVVAAVDWIAGSFLGGGTTAYVVSSVALGIPTVIACWFVLRMAIRAERTRVNELLAHAD